jgi:hypothetical protein
MINKRKSEYMIFDLLQPEQAIDEKKPPRIVSGARPLAPLSHKSPASSTTKLKKAS